VTESFAKECCILNEIIKDKEFWEELMTYFPLILYRSDRKDASNNSSIAAGGVCCHANMLTKPLPSNQATT
jgi:hypothetical protein